MRDKAPLKGELSAKLTEGFCLFHCSAYRETPPPPFGGSPPLSGEACKNRHQFKMLICYSHFVYSFKKIMSIDFFRKVLNICFFCGIMIIEGKDEAADDPDAADTG